ncbi:hypothetical protein COLO4_34827 [Corchorus olitorius]|uniref:TIR domain-containing protein n=1 Tax=Corchorus olitorius TaxID=93759 RepID=A0A1R3GJC7_9ROSI|nr:hypothetical protein COLO4_34827 [Corchorus olitorius]
MMRKFSVFSSPSPSPSHQRKFKFHIFLSFCGDTRTGFTDHLYSALIKKGIETFRDEESLEKGEELTPELLRAIRESWASIIVFSEGYASSRWCLKELAEIIKQRKERGLGVYPIFYDVDPSHLRNQTNKVGEAFKNHETNKKSSKEEMQNWRRALQDVTQIIGWDKKYQHEAKFLGDIVEEISKSISKEYPAESLSLLPSKGIMPSKSAELAGGQIMEALKDDGVNIIGLWGMGGVGKTTLVKEVGRQAKESKLFGEVVIVTVSQNPNIGKLQKEIAESLKLTLSNTTDVGRREQLCAALLQKGESILIILDDLWKKLDLKAVGIPVDEHHHKGCKILLTTRSQQVCSLMGSGQVVRLDVLDKDEAWQLFISCAELDDHITPFEILKVANEIVEECKGLPIALSALGKVLKNAEPNKWREAIRSLKSSKWPKFQSVSEYDNNAYKCLKVSYDFLSHEETKKCFLLCSLYPEDYPIPVEELVRHAWGLELFQDMKSIQEARHAVYAVVDELKACSLLSGDGQEKLVKMHDKVHDVALWIGFQKENHFVIKSESSGAKWVKMHDMVRDVALWIGSQKENHFVIKSESSGTKEWPTIENSEHFTAISFMACKQIGIPEGLQYPALESLSFRAGVWERDGKETTGVSAEGIKSLKVLNLLSMKGYFLWNNAIQFLTNLRSLRVENCRLHNYGISSLQNLKKLEILSFSGSDIEFLRNEVGLLKSLRLLDYSRCFGLNTFDPNFVIGRLSQLEELYLGKSRFQSLVAKNARCLEVLNKLPRLTILVLEVGDSKHVPKDFVFPKLQNYSIGIGDDTDEIYPSRPYLKIKKTDSLHAFQNLFEVVEVLELHSIENCQSLVDARNSQHVPVPVTFSNLSVLKIEGMDCFRELCNGPPPTGFLKKLETLEITRCGSLKSVFPASVTKNLEQLKSVKIFACDMLEQIIEEMQVSDGAMLSANTHLLPNLETLTIGDCAKLECLIDTRKQHLPAMEFLMSNLEVLELTGMTNLKFLFNGECPNPKGFLQKLQTLEIRGCSSMTCLFPLSFAHILLQLKKLVIEDCHMLKRLVMEEDIFIEMLSISDNHPRPTCLQELEQVEIRRCSKLEYVFPSSLGGDDLLPRLTHLELEDLNELKQVIAPGQGRDGNDVCLQLPLSLKTIKLSGFPKLTVSWTPLDGGMHLNKSRIQQQLTK